MSSAYRFVPMRSEHRDALAALQRDLWRGTDADNRAYFEWKYDNGPAVADSLVLVVLHHGRVIGMRGSIGMHWEAGPERTRFVATNAADLLIAPEHRGRELFPQLSRIGAEALSARGHAYELGWSAGPRPLSLVPRLDWIEAGSLQEWRCIPATRRRRLRAALQRTPVLGRATGPAPLYEFERPAEQRDPAARLAALPDPRWKTAEGLISLAKRARPEAMADLVERLGHDGRIRAVRDDRWFAWRFEDPFACNRFLFCDDGRLEGYAVLQARRNRPRGHIAVIDIEASSARIHRRLLDAMLRYVAIDKLKIWTTSFDDVARASLVDTGFAPVPVCADPTEPRAALIARRLAGADALERKLAGRLPTRIADWQVRGAYSDA